MTPSSFASAVNRQGSLYEAVGMVLSAVAFTALCAKIQVPFAPVPFTMQTFGVFITSMLLGPRLGTFAQLCYLGCGYLGLNVLASQAAGANVFAGATGGYLIGFACAAPILGIMASRGYDRSFGKCCLTMTLAGLAVMATGVPWLAHFVGWRTAFQSGFVVFIIPEAMKIVAASLIVSGLRKRV